MLSLPALLLPGWESKSPSIPGTSLPPPIQSMPPLTASAHNIEAGAQPLPAWFPLLQRSGASNTCGTTSARNLCSSRPGPATYSGRRTNLPHCRVRNLEPKPQAATAKSARRRTPEPPARLADARDGRSGPPRGPAAAPRTHTAERGQRGGARRGPPPARSLVSSALPSPRATPDQGVPGPHFLVSRAPFVSRHPSVPAQPRRAHLCSRSDPHKGTGERGSGLQCRHSMRARS